MESQNRVRCSSSSSHAYFHETQDQFSFFPSYSSPYAVASLTSNAEKIPHSSSSWYPSSDGNGYGDVASLKSDQQSFLQNDTAKSADQDLDSLDCDSEEGMEASEEPPKLAPARSSSSKRNRTAEVHNLSEKRRRSRINEKMKALQRLIPNSSKTDKASMLDEAIEYLKQLQLQVQMLSMRNSLSRHPKYMSGGVLQPLQALQMGIDFGLNNERTMNTQVEILPQNQNHGSSSVPNSFHLSNPPSASMPVVISISEPVTSFAMEASQHHHASFPLPVSFEEILTGNMMQHQQPDARHSSINSQASQQRFQ